MKKAELEYRKQVNKMYHDAGGLAEPIDIIVNVLIRVGSKLPTDILSTEENVDYLRWLFINDINDAFDAKMKGEKDGKRSSN